jgi:hypothetical protein
MSPAGLPELSNLGEAVREAVGEICPHPAPAMNLRRAAFLLEEAERLVESMLARQPAAARAVGVYARRESATES